MLNTDFVNSLTAKVGFPKEAQACFAELGERIASQPDFVAEILNLRHRYMMGGEKLGVMLSQLDEAAKKFGEVNYTLHLYFLMSCAEILLERYREAGISDEIYWGTMDDMRCKLLECYECEGVWGTFVADWYNGFFRMERFALGRLQFERSTFDHGEYTKGGVCLNDNSFVLNTHIPSSGKPLSRELRYDSYKKAFDFFKDEFNGGPAVFECSSWLLYPAHRDFLPAKCKNILDFMDDFDIIEFYEKDKFSNDWRVFGHFSDLPPEELPRDTALRKAYAERLCAGLPTGGGYGVIVFDGENIINK